MPCLQSHCWVSLSKCLSQVIDHEAPSQHVHGGLEPWAEFIQFEITISSIPMDVDLEIVANDLDDVTHSYMDQGVLSEAGGGPDEQRLTVLLFCIVGLSNRKAQFEV